MNDFARKLAAMTSYRNSFFVNKSVYNGTNVKQ